MKKEDLRNDYGNTFHKLLESETCKQCGAFCTPEHILYPYGEVDPQVYCSSRCLVKHYFDKALKDED